MKKVITIAAALVYTALWFFARRAGRPSGAEGTTALMFWGAALMWAVDCVHSAMEGEGLFDISKEDTILGCIILAAGLLVFGVMRFFERRSAGAKA